MTPVFAPNALLSYNCRNAVVPVSWPNPLGSPRMEGAAKHR